ncbi:MAG: uncharacterized protein KVP18_005256 [Porospora cf. gigantea A]|uniref:uncharacterized protein n=1 Tax=Porospora cf. gigantea A TaxID=2853593 RepID=UPI00355AB5AB|nr:MAG: hypothetical protein KVP18_005256 [Porospora cf. gigantea A]
MDKCKRAGCQKSFDPAVKEPCIHHPGAPVFHDAQKRWSCCNKGSWDWDVFMKIPGCTTSPEHTNLKVGRPNAKPVSASEPVIVPEPIKVPEPVQIPEQEVEVPVEIISFSVPVRDAQGKFKCTNPGCGVKYTSEDEECRHHPQMPVFRDVKKLWPCCSMHAYDWDDFMKIPTCSVGKHKPKTS